MLSRSYEYSFDVRSLRVGGPDRVPSFCNVNISVREQIYDYLGIADETMHMPGDVIVSVDDKSNSTELERTHP